MVYQIATKSTFVSVLFIIILSAGTCASALVGAWTFEDGGPGGITADVSGSAPASNATLGGAVIFNSGDTYRGKAVNCAGGGIKIPAKAQMVFSNSFTIQYWHKKTNAAEEWKYIVGCGGGGPRHFNKAGGMVFDTQTGDCGWCPIDTYRAPYTGTQVWHYVIATYDGTTLYGYIDGQLVGSVLRGGLVLSTGTNLWSIGEQWNGGTSGSWEGNRTTDLIDDVAIWRGYAPADSVLGLYNRTYTIYTVPIIEMPFPDPAYLAADYDRDGIVEPDDLDYMANNWLVNTLANGFIDMADFAELSWAWLNSDGTGLVMDTAMLNGAVTFQVDGNFVTVPSYSHNYPDPSRVPTAAFAARGTTVHDFGGFDVRPCWISDNQYNFGNADQRIRWVLQGDPDGQTMPWVGIDTPDWWLDDPANVNELERIDAGSGLSYYYVDAGVLGRNGRFPSIASVKWRQDVAKVLESYVDYLYEYGLMDNVAGFKLFGLGTGEWMQISANSTELAGYGVRTQEAFRQWLRDKYNNNLTALQTSWANKPSVTFDTAVVPTRSERMVFSPAGGNPTQTFRINLSTSKVYMDVIDFECFWNELVVDTQEYFARVIKAKTNGRKVVGAFYNYFYEDAGQPEYGYSAQNKYNRCDTLDFVWVTSSYKDRQFGTGCDYQRGPGLSAQLHNKLFYVSNDTATFLASYRSEDDKKSLGYTDTPEKNEMMFRRAAGFNATNGFYLDILDLDDQFYNDPVLYPIIGNLNAFYDRSKNYSRVSNAQVLIVSDEVSCSYASFKKGLNRLLDRSLLFTQPQLVKMGAQADHIFVDDIPLLPNPNQYKLVVFLNNYNATTQQRAYIDSLKGNNRVLLFVYAPGYFNGPQFGDALMQSMTGMTITSNAETIEKPIINMTPGHPLANAIIDKGMTVAGFDLLIGKRFYVTDPAATAIGKHYDNANYTTMAIKDMGTWKSIYSICMAKSPNESYDPTVWREIARYAGVHIYSETNDAFYVNSSYVCLHPSATAPRTITFPVAVDVYDATTETLLQSNATSYTWNATLGDTKLLRYVVR